MLPLVNVPWQSKPVSGGLTWLLPLCHPRGRPCAAGAMMAATDSASQADADDHCLTGVIMLPPRVLSKACIIDVRHAACTCALSSGRLRAGCAAQHIVRSVLTPYHGKCAARALINIGPSYCNVSPGGCPNVFMVRVSNISRYRGTIRKQVFELATPQDIRRVAQSDMPYRTWQL